ncbi:MAG: hypothetical protein A3H29_13190 [Acidobacteria bacterium RIFCSPLOWO2_02_FULL_67_21]|nr:MAG: hypothetical protein A3H29_13190 [Acidobacteria bacterium RIFCSPLOWO2_02_FULL_67_21]
MHPASQRSVGIRCDYQPDVDLLFAWVGDPQPAENIEVEPGIYVRVASSTGQVIGIEVLDCAERFGHEPDRIDAAFAKALLARFTAPALQRFREAHPQPPLFSSPR